MRKLINHRPSILFLLAVLLLSVQVVLAQPQKALSAASGNWVVFADTNGNLYSASLADGTLNTLFTSGESAEGMYGYHISPDGQSVIYQSDGLYSVPITGGEAVKFSELYVLAFGFTPDGQHIIYSKHDESENLQLWSMPSGGGDSTLLVDKDIDVFPIGSPDGKEKDYVLTPDGSTLVYFGINQRNNSMFLFAAPLTGDKPVKLSQALEPYSGTPDFSLKADGSQVIYTAFPKDADSIGFFSVPLAGGDPVDLIGSSGEKLASSSYHATYFMTEDGKNVFFMTGESAPYKLYVTPIMGGSPRLLTDAIAPGDINSPVRVSPDGEHALYTNSVEESYVYVDKDGKDQNGKRSVQRLFSLSVNDNGQPVDLLPPNTNTESYLELKHFVISPDGQFAIYQAMAHPQEVFQLYSVPVAGGNPVLLSADDQPVLDVGSYLDSESARRIYQISPDSQQVVYFAQDDNGLELLAVPIAGGTRTLLNTIPGSVGSGFNAIASYITADSSQVVYTLDLEQIGSADLYVVPISGGESIRLTPNSAYGDIMLELYR